MTYVLGRLEAKRVEAKLESMHNTIEGK